jgi:hypothetical protein
LVTTHALWVLTLPQLGPRKPGTDGSGAYLSRGGVLVGHTGLACNATW